MIVVAVVVTQPLPKDSGMAEKQGVAEAKQLPRLWTRGCKEIESCQRASDATSLKLEYAERDERFPG